MIIGRDTYPHTSRGTWYTRFHLLGRKIEKQDGCVTIHDVRLAAILDQTAARWLPNATLERAIDSLRWITDGSAPPYSSPEDQSSAHAPEARVGARQ